MKTATSKGQYCNRFGKRVAKYYYVDFDEESGTVSWYVYVGTPRNRRDAVPRVWGDFSVEVYIDGTFLPYEETFDEATRKHWDTLRDMCLNVGMRTNDD